MTPKPGKGRAKKPTIAVTVPAGKTPRLPTMQESPDRPSWRFYCCDHGGPYAWDFAALGRYLDKLAHFETKKWGEIEGSGTIGAKRIPLDDLPNAAKRRLEQIEQDDVDALYELRVGGAPRFWGHRVGSTLHFLWWDPDHQVFP